MKAPGDSGPKYSVRIGSLDPAETVESPSAINSEIELLPLGSYLATAVNGLVTPFLGTNPAVVQVVLEDRLTFIFPSALSNNNFNGCQLSSKVAVPDNRTSSRTIVGRR